MSFNFGSNNLLNMKDFDLDYTKNNAQVSSFDKLNYLTGDSDSKSDDSFLSGVSKFIKNPVVKGVMAFANWLMD